MQTKNLSEAEAIEAYSKIRKKTNSAQDAYNQITSGKVIGKLEYIHYIKPKKVTDINELQNHVNGQIAAFNRIIEEEGLEGLKKRINSYSPELEEGRKYVKSLEPAPSGYANLHEPDMKVGGHPKDVTRVGIRRNNSIIGGQADRIAREILNMDENVTKIIGRLIIIGG